jgi:hypothetical protein
MKRVREGEYRRTERMWWLQGASALEQRLRERREKRGGGVSPDKNDAKGCEEEEEVGERGRGEKPESPKREKREREESITRG